MTDPAERYRNPSIPPPPPPPGPKRVESQESVGLSDVEKVLFKNSAEYGNLSPQEAQMTPKLREVLGNFRKDRLFAVDTYALSGGGDGSAGGATYDQKALKIEGALNTSADIHPNRNPGRYQESSQEYKRSLHVAEALAFTPMQTRPKETVEKVVRPSGWFRKEIKEKTTVRGPLRPTKFQEIFPAAQPEISQDQAIRLTYDVSDPSDPMRYTTDTRMDVSWRQTEDEYISQASMYRPKPTSTDTAQNIDAHMKDILHVPYVKPSGPRPDNQMTISVMLPLSRARELWNYFQQNPQHVRPFFIAGAEDLMPLHLPPPYKAWDKELQSKPVLLREFNNSKEEISKKIIPASK